MREIDYQFIRKLVYERSRINLGDDKHELVAARLGKVVRATAAASIDEYCRTLRHGASEDDLARLIDAIATNHTAFFRENAHFDFLATRVLPELAGRRAAERWRSLRLWSAACSSGEEPYTIAIRLAEEMPAVAPDWPWGVEATDISHRVLAHARAGIYGGETVSRIDRSRLRRHFLAGFGPQEGKFRVRPDLQEAVNFAHLDLVNGAYPFVEPFHVVFCRNVMIYFDRETQEKLVTRLIAQLVPGGYLLVGHSENLSGIQGPLQTVRPSIYRRPEICRS
jgi:chemotaxis protein methyltransferase CheR